MAKTRIGGIHFAIATALVVLLSCYSSIELPKDRADFAGRWSSGPNFFEVTVAGEVDLELNGPTSTLYIQHGRLRSFGETHIEVGIGGCWKADRLSISQFPYDTPDGLAIRLEGIELYREGSPDP